MKSSIVLGALVLGVSIASISAAKGSAAKGSAAKGSAAKNAAEKTATAGAKKANDLAVGQRRMQRSYDVTLQNGCAYHATVNGTIDGVREHGAPTVQLLPDLFVDATFDCPREKQAHVARHLVHARFASADDLEEALRSAMSIPTGGCFYLPDLQRKGLDFEAKSVSWMCPSETTNAIGGGPKPKK